MKKKNNFNYRDRNSCPLDNKYLTPEVTYREDVLASITVQKTYFGLSEAAFKEGIMSIILNIETMRQAQAT